MSPDHVAHSCPSWCRGRGDHDHHISGPITVHVMNSSGSGHDVIDYVVERFDIDDTIGKPEIVATLVTDGRRELLNTPIGPASARALAAVLLRMAELAERDQ